MYVLQGGVSTKASPQGSPISFSAGATAHGFSRGSTRGDRVASRRLRFRADRTVRRIKVVSSVEMVENLMGELPSFADQL